MYVKTLQEHGFNIANLSDIKFIKSLFAKHKNPFPHINETYIMSMLNSKRIIKENSVILIYKIIEQRILLGNVEILPGTIYIKQLLSRYEGKGYARNLINRIIITTKKTNHFDR